MATPTADEIRESALELFFRQNPGATTPEDYELKEGGFWNQARDDLMRGESTEALSYLEEQAAQLGRRVVTEDEHAKLIDLGLRLEKLRKREKEVKTAEEHAEAIRNLNAQTKSLQKTIEHREGSDRIKKHGKKAKKKKKPKRLLRTCKARMLRACKQRGIERSECQKLLKYTCRKAKSSFGVPELPVIPAV